MGHILQFYFSMPRLQLRNGAYFAVLLLHAPYLAFSHGQFTAVPFALRYASCSCHAVALSSIRNLSRPVSKLTPAQVLHPAPLVETHKLEVVLFYEQCADGAQYAWELAHKCTFMGMAPLNSRNYSDNKMFITNRTILFI